MLLFSKDFTEELTQSIDEASSELVICSAFVKLNAIKHLLRNVSSNVSISIIARWAKQDLFFGASDLEVYGWCQSKGYRFGVNNKLHAKIYSIDRTLIFLGSANLTHRGLSISGSGNVEIGTRIDPSTTDMSKFKTFIDDSVVWMDPLLYQKLVVEVEDSKISAHDDDNNSWSEDIDQQLQKRISHLWVNDLLFTSPKKLLRPDFNKEEIIHDFELLRLDLDTLNSNLLKGGFLQTRLYQWLRATIGVDDPVRFGWLTKQLHDALLDDATPYRSEVKDFVVTLFDWFKFMPEHFEVTKFNVSEKVRIKE